MAIFMDNILFLIPLIWVPLLSMLLAAFFVHRSIALLCHYGFAAEMGARHIHKRVIPTAGGIGMIAAFILSCLIYNAWIYGFHLENAVPINLDLFIPVILLFFIGLYDDRFGMRPVVKLMGQIAACLLAWICGLRFGAFFGIPLPEYLSCIITVFWFLLFINAFNLIDGLDGLAAGLAVLAGLSLAAILFINREWSAAILALALVGACLGFLRYNFHPARVFMGDTGSMFLGYMLAGIGLVTSNKGVSFFAMMVPIMACGIPLIDTMLAVWRRATFKILSKRSWREIMSADRSHLHHRILDAQHANQSRTAVIIYILAIILSVVGIIASTIGDSLPMLAVLLILFTLILVLRKFAVLEMWNSTQLVFKGLAMPRKSVFVNVLHPAYDLMVIAGAFALSIWFFDTHSDVDFMRQFVISGLILVGVLAFSRTYKVFWLRAGTPDHVRLFYYLSLGFLIVLGVYGVANRYCHEQWDLLVLLPAYLMTVVGILGERILLRWLQLMLPRYYHDSEFNHDCVPTLLYGAGAQLSSYQRFSTAKLSRSGEHVIGIVDNDRALLGSYIYGYPILGDISQLEAIYKRHFFAKIVVITAHPIRCNYEILKNFCHKNNIRLTFFVMNECEEPIMLRESPQTQDAADLDPIQ